MIPRCICGKYAHYGFSELKNDQSRFCSVCKLPGMIHLTARRCLHEGCILFPAYGRKEESASFCKNHAKKGMFNKAASKCEKCSKFASFNYPGEKRRIRCKKHIKKGMINLNKYKLRKEKKEKKENEIMYNQILSNLDFSVPLSLEGIPDIDMGLFS